MIMVVCGICGKFLLDNVAQFVSESLRDKGDNRLYKLSYIFRTISDKARGIRDNSFFPVYSREDIEEMLDRPAPSVQEKLTALLKHLSTLSAFPGEWERSDLLYGNPP
jgi:hypothetical protein